MTYKNFKLNKLVRTKTKDSIESQNMKGVFKTLSPGSFFYYIRYKLVEESREVLFARSKKNLTEELGDAWEVLNKVCQVNRINISTLFKQDYNIESHGNNIYEIKQSLLNTAKNFVKTTNKEEATESLKKYWVYFNLIMKNTDVSMSDILQDNQKKITERGPIDNILLYILSVPEGHELESKYLKKYTPMKPA